MRQLIKQFHGSVGMITCPDIDSKGSGFLVSPDGHVLTCNHVVALPTFTSGVLAMNVSSNISVHLNGTTFPAALLTQPTDPECIAFDYAILKVSGVDPFQSVKIGTFSDVEPGDEVLCLGYPLTFTSLVATHGIVSSLLRRRSHFNALHNMNTVLTDALVQFGHSGGPLVHVPTASVVAVNTLKESYQNAQVQTLQLSLQRPDVQAVPGLTDVIEYLLKFTHVGLNFAVSIEHAQASQQWPY